MSAKTRSHACVLHRNAKICLYFKRSIFAGIHDDVRSRRYCLFLGEHISSRNKSKYRLNGSLDLANSVHTLSKGSLDIAIAAGMHVDPAPADAAVSPNLKQLSLCSSASGSTCCHPSSPTPAVPSAAATTSGDSGEGGSDSGCRN